MTGFRVVQCRQDSVLPPDWMAATGRLLSDAVAQGAALGWVDPPTVGETTVLLSEVRHQATTGDASLLVAVSAADVIVGAGYWRRYARPTHLPHADLERLVVDRDHRRSRHRAGTGDRADRLGPTCRDRTADARRTR